MLASVLSRKPKTLARGTLLKSCSFQLLKKAACHGKLADLCRTLKQMKFVEGKLSRVYRWFIVRLILSRLNVVWKLK